MPKIPKLRVLEKDLANLRESGLTDKTIRENGLYTTDDYEELKSTLNRLSCHSGLVFPYRNLNGEINGYAVVRLTFRTSL